MVEKEERGGSREFKEKATQNVCLCEREKEQCWLRNGARGPGKPSPRTPQLPWGAPRGCPGSGASLGVPRPLLGGRQLEMLHQGPSQNARVPCPLPSILRHTGCLVALCIQQELLKHRMDTRQGTAPG